MCDSVTLDDYFLAYQLWKCGILQNCFFNHQFWWTLAVCILKKFELAVVKNKISLLNSLTHLSFKPIIYVLLIQLNALTENCRNKFGSKVCWVEE